jgi:hypothetical protein
MFDLGFVSRENSGQATIPITVNTSMLHSANFGQFNSPTTRMMSITYLWQHVVIEQSNETVYIIVFRTLNDSNSLKTIQTNFGMDYVIYTF